MRESISHINLIPKITLKLYLDMVSSSPADNLPRELRGKPTGLSTRVTIAPQDWLFVDHLISEAGSNLKIT